VHDHRLYPPSKTALEILNKDLLVGDKSNACKMMKRPVHACAPKAEA
jgi:hypothetical protein